jgi:signal transduction histidine kinase
MIVRVRRLTLAGLVGVLVLPTSVPLAVLALATLRGPHQPRLELAAMLVGVVVVTAVQVCLAVTLRRTWRAEAAMAAANAQLRADDQFKTDLIGMLSHEVGQPLTSIRGYAEVLQDGWETLTPARREQAIGRIDAGARRLTQIVDEVLSMCKLDAGVIRSRSAPVRLDDAIRAAVDAVSGRLDEVKVNVSPGLTAVVDPGHLQQMMVNLLTNAAKYGAPPVTVDADVAADNDTVAVRVRDCGDGVPDGFVGHLFERYTRAETGAARRAPGTGLGLFIVARLAEANRGSVAYQRNEPTGACFVIHLPGRVKDPRTPVKDPRRQA